MDIAPPGGAAPRTDNPVNATRFPTTLGGAPVYAAYFEGGQGYRIDNTSGVATGNAAEVLYMVTKGDHFNGGCCFDFGSVRSSSCVSLMEGAHLIRRAGPGNRPSEHRLRPGPSLAPNPALTHTNAHSQAETNNHDTGAGSMEAVYFGNSTDWGRGGGSGPWVMADLENGLWAGNERVNPNNTPLTMPFVTAMVKGGENGFALKGGDATQGTLTTMYDGPRPNGYQPMKKQGAIILGIGGDNSDWAVGTFFEGVVTRGYTTDAVDDAVQANIVAAGYGK
jgi:non-reducing end alpha-L-arabinofuranosidase